MHERSNDEKGKKKNERNCVWCDSHVTGVHTK